MKLLLYCTKAKPYLNDCKLINHNKRYFTSNKGIWSINLSTQQTYSNLNGKVVAECDFEVDAIVMQKGSGIIDKFYNNDFIGYGIISKNHSFSWYDENKGGLSEEELFKYLEGFKQPYLIPTNYKCKNGYAIHIKNLKIFDKPKELNEYDAYEYEVFSDRGGCLGTEWKSLEKAPQNMMYCYDEGEKKILISIRPEWLCKILNGEKTIEVRKKVLNEMKQQFMIL